jgi:hypothetical protein
MRRICSGVLISTPRSRRALQLSWTAVERLEDALGDLVDLAHAVDLEQDAAVAVDVDQRRGLSP